MLSREEIEKEINLGNFEYVIEKCNEYLNLNSDLAFLYNYRGLCKNNLGLYEEAIKDFDISIELNKKVENIPYATNKDLADAYYYKGLAKKDLGEYEEAIKDFQEALKYNRTYLLIVYYNIGISKINLGEYNPFDRNYIYQYNNPLDIQKMRLALNYFKGISYEASSKSIDGKDVKVILSNKNNGYYELYALYPVNDNSFVEIYYLGSEYDENFLDEIINFEDNSLLKL